MIRRPFPTRRPPLPWWLTFGAGAAAGLAAGLLLAGRDRIRPAPDRAPPGEEPPSGRGASGQRSREGWGERAWRGAVQGLEQARDLLVGPVAVDLEALRARLGELPSADGVRVRELGEGILEVVGRAPDDAAARALLEAVAAEPGVEVVVNRVWTPSSAVHNLAGPHP